MIKLDRFDVHDRLTHFKKQNSSINECCQDLINQAPFGYRQFYIFAHARTLDMDERIAILNMDIQCALSDPTYKRRFKSTEDVPDKRLVWQPRLTRPKAQTNSMLFKVWPGSDIIYVCWRIPAREMWDQYQKGKITYDKDICEDIYNFNHNRIALESPDPDDPSDEIINAIYLEIAAEGKRKKLMDKLYSGQ